MKINLSKITINEIKKTCENVNSLNKKEKAKFLFLAIDHELVDEVKLLIQANTDIYYPINDTNCLNYAKQKVFFTDKFIKRNQISQLLNQYDEKLSLETMLSQLSQKAKKIKI